MTENEPQQPQGSPWAPSGAGRADAGDRQQGAGRPEEGGPGAVQGSSVPPGGTGAGGAVQGSAAAPDNGEQGAAQGSTPPPTSAYGVRQGDTARLDTGGAHAPQGESAPPSTGGQGASQGSTPTPDTGTPSAPHGSAASPVPGFFGNPIGSPGAVQGSAGQSYSGWGSAQPSGEPGVQQGTPGQPGPYFAPPGSVVTQPRPRERGRGKVVAGITALVLGVGGLAGGIGGYIGYQAAERSGPVTNALNAPPPARQTDNPATGSIEQVAQKVLPAVVQVQVSGGAGSGIVVSSDGLVLTNNHVVESAAAGGPMKVQFQDGKSVPAKIVGRDPTSDLAVVKADDVSGLATAELGSSGDLRIGQQVVAVGSPFDLNGTVTSGIVSSLNRPVKAGGEDGSQTTVLNAIQTDAAINPGNSGGPLVDMQGRVVGVNSAIYSPNREGSQAGSVGIGFAIPIDQAKRTAKELSETGKATQTVLGVQVVDNQQGGALVRDVTSGGAADQAGLKPGDVITRFGDRPIATSDALVAAVRSRAPGEKVQMTVGGKTVEVTLGSQPVETR
ncbi:MULTISPECIES: trypsin-like peptidase domain-containing protein [unclassified Saccharothrix]|uniref:trypsin-like peptidase domain-containing protein n=1 Tax=unclassified Saccharothrix TaxID=2593673 RepID=UPI00307DF9A4